MRDEAEYKGSSEAGGLGARRCRDAEGGTVFLVGAGPGDPGLITARGLELIRECDVLVYDRLVSDELVAEAPGDAILVGREPLGQDEISELLVRYGRRGLDVVRLKGGDPYIFGRGGEEALALAEADVPFEVVPGVSSLSAVPAAAGIPVTHRGLASQVTIASGHDPQALDYEALARVPGTIVLFMALAGLAEIAASLIAHGCDPDTPTAVIARGTTPEEDAVISTLAQVVEAAEGIDSPALVVVGDVVGLASVLGAPSECLAVEA